MPGHKNKKKEAGKMGPGGESPKKGKPETGKDIMDKAKKVTPLDPDAQKKMNLTAIMVHHDMKLALEFANRVAVIKEGQKITADDLTSKRPGTGIPSKNLYKVIGKKAKRNILKDKLISNRDF